MKKVAVFVKDQYRIQDHLALSAAMEHSKNIDGSNYHPSVFAFTVRDELLKWDHESDRPLCGPFRKKFQDQAIEAFQINLQKLGIPFINFECDSSNSEVLERLQQQGIDSIFCSTEHLQQYQWLEDAKKHSIEVKSFAGNHLFSDWPIEQDHFPKVFTDFKKKIQRSPDLPTLDLNSMDTIDLQSNPEDPRSAIPFHGGEPSALSRLNHYFLGSEGLSQYKKTRNGLIGTEYSSKLSPFLAIGSVSVRQIWSTIDQHDSRFGKDEGSEWMRYELLWREFFYWQSLQYPDQFFASTGIQNKNQSCTPDLSKFESWIRGQTGDDFVDACMNELRTTGYLSNRGRQNAASYLVHTLQLPWLWGARYFEWILIDFDRTQNYGNWAYLAGVGADPRSFGNQGPRFFNTLKQAQDYDPDSSYRRLWKKA